MALTIKAYLTPRGSQPESRRFEVPPDVKSFSSVKQKIAGVFPSLHNKPFSLQWTDQEGNLVTFSSDQELQEAVSTVTDGVLLVHVITDQEGDRVTFSSDQELQAAVSTVTDGVQRIHVVPADTVDLVPGCQTDAKEVTEGQKRNSNILVSPSAESEQPIIDVTSRSEDVPPVKDQEVTSPTTSEDWTLLTPAQRGITNGDDDQSETLYPNINGETQPGYPPAFALYPFHSNVNMKDEFAGCNEYDDDDGDNDNDEDLYDYCYDNSDKRNKNDSGDEDDDDYRDYDDDSDSDSNDSDSDSNDSDDNDDDSDDNDDDISLNVVSLNVCGLKKRLRSQKFIDLLQNKDIICLQETKTNTDDEFEIDGFTLYLKHRIDALVRSGGMGIAVKNEYAEYITPIDDECKYILWINISKDLFDTDQDMCLGNVYIPPKGSPYANDDMFHEVEQSIGNALSLSEYVVLMGDFNARTNNKCDYERRHDTHLPEGPNIETSDLDNTFDPEKLLDTLNLPRVRTTQDIKKENNHGKKLINICKTLHLFICNGRIGKDKILGKTTCDKKSVIDYIIASPQSLHLFSDLSIMSLSKSLSDKHCPVICTLKLPTQDHEEQLTCTKDTNIQDSKP